MIGKALTLLSYIYVARVLGKEAFGEFGIIQSTVGMLGAFAGFGLGVTATKYVAEFRSSDPMRAGRIMALSSAFSLSSGALFAVVLAVAAPWLAENTLAAPKLGRLLQIGGVLLLLNAQIGAQGGVLSGLESFKTIAGIGFWSGLATLPIMVAGAYLGKLDGAVYGLIASRSILWGLNHLALRKEADRCGIPFVFTGYMQERSILWKFSLPAVLSGVLVGPVNWMCAAMLVNRPDGYAQMGIFNAADQWYAALLFIPSVVGRVVLPVLSERIGANDARRARKVLVATIAGYAIFTLPFVLLGCLLSPFIMSFYGKEFEEGWATLSVVLLTVAVLGVQMPVGQAVAASGKMWAGFYMNFGWAAVFLLANSSLLFLGALGLSTARLLAYVAHLVWSFAFVWFQFKRGIFFDKIGRAEEEENTEVR